MKTCVYLWQSLAEFFLEREIIQTKAVQNIKTQHSEPFPKIIPLRDNVEMFGTA